MSTAMIVNEKRVTLTIEQKARMLQVLDINDPNRFIVPSGSEKGKAYSVKHDGYEATSCNCLAHGKCAHKTAVNWKLEADRRAWHNDLFDFNYTYCY